MRHLSRSSILILLPLFACDEPDESIVESANTNVTCPALADAVTQLPPTLTKVDPVQVGRIDGAFGVSASGTATYQMPLIVPPGRHGMAPKLWLGYDSSVGEATAGMGMSLGGLSSIQRCPLTYARDATLRAVQYDTSDAFCLDGRRLVAIGKTANNEVEYRTFPDQQVRVIAHVDGGWDPDRGPTWFEVETKDGVTHSYGKRSDGRVIVDRGTVGSWWITEDLDQRGNWIAYYYDNQVSEAETMHTRRFYPSYIEYTGHSTQKPTRRVDFVYTSWSPHASAFVNGIDIVRDRRLQQVRMKLLDRAGTLVRVYTMSYTQNPATGRALLDTVRECTNDLPTSCKPPTKLTWLTNAGGALAAPVTVATVAPIEEIEHPVTADVTGDGLEDLVYEQGTFVESSIVVAKNRGDGTYDAPKEWLDESLSNVQVLDYDQDGRADLLELEPPEMDDTTPNADFKIYRSTGNDSFEELAPALLGTTTEGLGAPPYGCTGEYAQWTNTAKRHHVADINGDGMSDVTVCYEVVACVTKVSCDANGNSSSSTSCSKDVDFWNIAFGVPGGFGFHQPLPAPLGTSSCSSDIKFVDLERDGKVDILAPPSNWFIGGCPTCTYQAITFEPTGRPHESGSLPGTFTSRDSGLPMHVVNRSTAFLDVNGDGLVDAVQPDGDSLVTRLNTGKSFAPAVTSISSPPVVPAPEKLSSHLDDALPMDFDGDGNDDLLLPIGCPALAIPDLCWFVLKANWSGDGTFVAQQLPIKLRDGGELQPGLSVTDATGDGRHDLVAFKVAQAQLHQNASRHGVVSTITDGMNPLDATDAGFVPDVAITYGNLVDRKRLEGFASESQAEDDATYVGQWSYQANPCSYPRGCLAGATTVVRRYRLNSGVNTSRTFDVRYRNGRFDRLDGGALGFGAKIVYDTLTGATDVNFYDNQTYDVARHHYPYAGRLAKSWSWKPPLFGQPDTTELAIGVTEVANSMRPTSGGLTYFSYDGQRRERKFEGAWPPPSGKTMFQWARDQMFVYAYQLSDSVAVVTEMDDHANVRGEYNETFGVGRLTTTRFFSDDETNWLLGLVDIETTCSKVGTETQCRWTDHDYNSYGEPTQKIVEQPGDLTTRLTSGVDYDTFGNPISTWTTDVGGDHRSACSTFDSEGMYAIAQRNALSHTVYTTYDSGLGIPRAKRDPNGLITQWQLDGFGRQLKEVRPDGTQTNITRTRTKDGGPSGTWWNEKVRTVVTGGADITEELDMRGRMVRRDRRGPSLQACEQSICTSAPRYAETIEYDIFGNVSKESRPFLTVAPSTAVYTQYLYDALMRRVRVTTPWGEKTNIDYQLRTTTRSDSAGNEITEADASGRPVKITDRKGTLTTQVFGPFGALRSVTTANEVTTWDTDAFTRVLSVVDPNRGKTTTIHNGHGDPRFVTDQLDRTVETKYDVLGRRRYRIDKDGTTSWTYDPVNCAGCIWRTDSPDKVARIFKYDTLARRIETRLEVNGTPYVTSVDYDPQSRPWKFRYPDGQGVVGPTIELTRDSIGTVYRVSNPTAMALPYWEAKQVDGTGRVTQEALGNKLTTTHEYYLQRGTVKRIRTSAPTSVIADLEYDYDMRLNPTMRRDNLDKQVEYFKYDELDRLWCQTWSLEDPKCALELTYKANGNISTKSDVGTYVYDPAHPHAVQNAGASTYGYDAVGNQTSRPGATIDYTPFDLPRKYTLGTTSSTFEYDADQARVRKVGTGFEKIYLDDLYELRIASAAEHRYYIAAGSSSIVLTRVAGKPDQLAYLHSDALGTTNLITDALTTVVQKRSHDPFGARRNLDWDQPPVLPYSFLVTEDGFTGHEHDDEIGLINMRGRIYDPVVGRFLQTDPVNTDPLFSQRWNAYSYVLNNPLRYTDPTGRDGEEVSTLADPSMEQSVEPSSVCVAPVADPHRVGNGPLAANRTGPAGDQSAPAPSAVATNVPTMEEQMAMALRRAPIEVWSSSDRRSDDMVEELRPWAPYERRFKNGHEESAPLGTEAFHRAAGVGDFYSSTLPIGEPVFVAQTTGQVLLRATQNAAQDPPGRVEAWNEDGVRSSSGWTGSQATVRAALASAAIMGNPFARAGYFDYVGGKEYPGLWRASNAEVKEIIRTPAPPGSHSVYEVRGLPVCSSCRGFASDITTREHRTITLIDGTHTLTFTPTPNVMLATPHGSTNIYVLPARTPARLMPR